MLCSRLQNLTLHFAVLASVVCLSAPAQAAKPTPEKVELFAAMKADQVEVKFVPKDATQATVMIKNKTNRPLSIQLPQAFAGVPVLAQNNNNNAGGGGGRNSGSSSTNSQQSMGGGMMGGMGGMGGMGMGGFFDVGPERAGKIKVATVCLEHGKLDPNPRVAYELKPITDFTNDPAVAEVCMLLGAGKLDQSTAQAAAWHLTDGLTWQELASKIKVKHLNGAVEMYFNAQQLNAANQVVQVAREHAEKTRAISPGEEADALSLNN